MSNLFSTFFKKIQNLDKNFALLVCFLFLAGIYPSKRFLVDYAIPIKIYMGGIALSALFYFLKNSIRKQYSCLLLLLSGTLLALACSVFSSWYPVRAGSELDILLGAFAFAFLFCFWGRDNLQKALQLLGIFTLIFLHFSACLTLTCARESAPYTYPFSGLFLHNFFNLTTLLQLFSLKDVRCPLDYTHYTGLFTVMAFPFFVGLFLSEKNRFRKCLWILGIFYALFLGYASHGKSCILLLMFEIFTFLTLFFIYNKRLSAKCKCLTFASLFLFFGAILVVTPRFRYDILNSLINTGVKGFLSQRYYLAQSGFELVKDKPLFGHGITTTPLHYLESKPDDVHHCWQLHVAPVQFLIEFGWIGGLLYLCLLIYILYCGVKVLRNKTIPRHYRQLTLGCFLSFIGYLLFITESSWDVFADACFACVIGGILISLYHQFHQKSQDICPYGFIYKLTIPIAFIVCLSFSIKDILARDYFENALRYLTPDTEKQAFYFIRKALQQDPNNLHILNQAGYYLAKRGYCRNKAIAKQAITFYEESIAINPNQLEILESLGALHIYVGNAYRGIKYFCDTIECLPHKTATYIQLLDALKHFHQQELYDQWLGIFTFIRPDIALSQPALIEELQKNINAQNICLKSFENIEKTYPDENHGDYWELEKYFRNALFKNDFHKLVLKNYDLLKSFNWGNALNWSRLLAAAETARKQSRFYYMFLDQHSNMNILLHGGMGTRIYIATLAPVFDPKSNKINILCAGGKHARELVRPLLQKTRAWAKTL